MYTPIVKTVHACTVICTLHVLYSYMYMYMYCACTCTVHVHVLGMYMYCACTCTCSYRTHGVCVCTLYMYMYVEDCFGFSREKSGRQFKRTEEHYTQVELVEGIRYHWRRGGTASQSTCVLHSYVYTCTCCNIGIHLTYNVYV